MFEVQNNFIKKRVTAKSSERWSAYIKRVLFPTITRVGILF